MTQPMSLPATYPRRALRASIYLIAIECLILALPSGNWSVTGGLFLIAASRWWTIRQGWALSMPLSWNALFLAVVFATKFTVLPASFSDDLDFANTTLAHEIGCWLVATQILILHEPSSRKRIPVAFAALGCLAILCAGDVRLHSVSRTTTLGLMMLFAGGLGWFAHTGRDWLPTDPRRRLRRVILLVTLVLASVPTVYAAQVWHQHERDLEVLLLHLMRVFDETHSRPRSNSHSALAKVSNGKMVEPEKPVLRVSAEDSEPLYLRGIVLDSYRLNATWTTGPSSPPNSLYPRMVPEGRGLPPDEAFFQIHPSAAQQWHTANVNYLSKDDPVPMALLDTAEISIAVDQLSVDSLGNLRIIEASLPDSLAIYTPLSAEPDEAPPPDAEVHYFSPRLDPRIWDMAQSICDGKTTDSEKIRAVESFFHENYLYQIGLETPGHMDPVAYFLLTEPRPAAHCEYFASGAALLLRAVGVPTRYVTGYVPSERHSEGFWIARRKDAHAWVEAFDSDLGRWVTVEATPAAGLPERRTATWSNEFFESWRVWSQTFQQTMSNYGTWAAISMVLQANITRCLLVLVLLASWWILNRRYHRERERQTPLASSRAFPFQQWLFELEADLARRGFQRLPQETLLKFQDRILASPHGLQLRPIAEWYAAYSSIRYNESEQTAERVAQLERSWQSLASRPDLGPNPLGASRG